MSHLLDTAASKGHLRGIKIGNGVPAITHLQFTDDSLFFCQANERNFSRLKKIFSTFEECSVQKINTAKSTITFGSCIPDDLQGRLKSILQIDNQGGRGKYLGLPERFGRKKKDMFSFIVNKVKQKTTRWSSQFVSPAGKEVLLKSNAISSPVFSMSCYKIPQQIISELTSDVEILVGEITNC